MKFKTISSISELKKEKNDARNFWKEELHESYSKKVPQTDKIISSIKKHCNPLNENKNNLISVFEFGCHTGRNLFYIKKAFPQLKIFGIDINEKAIKTGKEKFGVPIRFGDEQYLSTIPDNSYDFVFTVSVIDHLVEPEKVCKELTRISKKYIVMLEPFYGKEGKILEMPKPKFRFWLKKTLPYTYSWDYTRIFSNLNVKQLSNSSCPLTDRYSGPFYRLYEYMKL